MQQIKRCPNGCHVTDTNKLRCPRCDATLKKDGPVTQENKDRVVKDIEQMQLNSMR